jgi:hypothetical protein
MDLMLLRLFQGQIKFQCDCAMIATSDLESALTKNDVTATFSAIQALLGAAANISKALWGLRKTKSALAARLPLRASLQVLDNSPLNPRTMRDNYEHFDERLDKWWKDSKHHNIADMHLMPRAAIQGFENIERFRAFDPQTGDLTFWGDDLNLNEIITEIRRIHPIVIEESNKPHWQPNSPQP